MAKNKPKSVHTSRRHAKNDKKGNMGTNANVTTEIDAKEKAVDSPVDNATKGITGVPEAQNLANVALQLFEEVINLEHTTEPETEATYNHIISPQERWAVIGLDLRLKPAARLRWLSDRIIEIRNERPYEFPAFNRRCCNMASLLFTEFQYQRQVVGARIFARGRTGELTDLEHLNELSKTWMDGLEAILYGNLEVGGQAWEQLMMMDMDAVQKLFEDAHPKEGLVYP
jgi:hypothetical protein